MTMMSSVTGYTQSDLSHKGKFLTFPAQIWCKISSWTGDSINFSFSPLDLYCKPRLLARKKLRKETTKFLFYGSSHNLVLTFCTLGRCPMPSHLGLLDKTTWWFSQGCPPPFPPNSSTHSMPWKFYLMQDTQDPVSFVCLHCQSFSLPYIFKAVDHAL